VHLHSLVGDAQVLATLSLASPPSFNRKVKDREVILGRVRDLTGLIKG
jgi:hypothetical protein